MHVYCKGLYYRLHSLMQVFSRRESVLRIVKSIGSNSGGGAILRGE